MTTFDLDPEAIAAEIGHPYPDEWGGNCHGISLAIVKAGLIPGRVARGRGIGVTSQHSWIVVGADADVYAEDAEIVDPTLFHYRDDVDGIWHGTAADGIHHPHGAGDIWSWGHPPKATEEPIALTPSFPLSGAAESFVDLLGPLDRAGWGMLATHAPVGGWPAAEILAAMDDTPAVAALVPIDRLGMLTQRNPDGLYLAGEADRR